MAVEVHDALWIADPDDVAYPNAPTTPRVDLNPVGCSLTTYGFVLMDTPAPNLVVPRRSLSLGALNRDGDRLAAQSHGNAALVFRLAYKGDPAGDFTQILDDVRELAEALLDGGVLAWKVHGMTDPVFYDWEPSGVPHYLQGQGRGLYELARRLVDTNGVPITFDAYPWPRLPEVAGVDTTIANEDLAQHVVVVNPGNVAGEARPSISPTAGRMGWLCVGIRSRGNLTEWATWYARDSSTWDLDNGTALVADTEGVGGFVAETDFAGVAYHARRFRDPRVVTDPTAAEGVHRVWVRCRAVGAGTRSLFRVQRRVGFAANDLTQDSGPRWFMDWRNVPTASLEYIWFDLGLVTVPAGVEEVDVDVWAEQLEGDQEVRFDQVKLIPADEWESIGANPGFRLGRRGQQWFEADEMDGTGNLKDGTYRLNAINEVAYTPDLTLPAGVHTVTFKGVLREPKDPSITDGPNPTAKVLGALQVIAIATGPVETTRATANLRTKKNRKHDRVEVELQFEVTAADVSAGTVFRPEIEQTAATLDGRSIRVSEVVVSSVPAVPSGASIVLDNDVRPNKQRAHVENATGGSIFNFPLENDLPWQPKGSAAWAFLWGDLPIHPGYAEIDDRGPVALAIFARAAVVNIPHTPRVTH